MAFTRGWDTTTPAGTRAAAQIDDAIRELKVDIDDRWVSKIFTSVPNDTVEANLVVQPSISGTLTARRMCFGPQILINFNSDITAIQGDEVWQSNTNFQSSAWGNIILPTGVTIQDFEFISNRQTRTSVTAELFYTTFGVSPASTTISSLTRTAAGIGIESAPGAIANVVNSEDRMYKVKVTAAGSGAYLIYGFRITIDRPDCRNTW